ncbi:ABC transporter ATP-binding protein [Ehrlichia ruminantium]|uniref:ABC transporter ATP-binding protein n=1 Tax=Ehrlichia ruminantium TaxID=779 RepID=UPI0015DC3EAA|nr:ABC transporter ATP-binding protein [Ehrlichia ruminantium]QLK53092.1 ABC transporter ATP-binding protein [Ehrlichia ruminantium]QLK57675.1 ABC transporter ATP-binding protein [Ehrlichia ruminantium]UOD98135.1 ABC transporter ATP-binding protein [Ehrlichia ruminantium]
MIGLQLENVSYKYKKGQFLLSDVNIICKKGEVICLLGPSGCGKSTVLKLIAGLENLSQGSIYINDKVIVNNDFYVPTEKRNVGLIFQHPSLFPHQTVIENVMFAIKEPPKMQKFQVALDILQSVNMGAYKDMYPDMLSGGQQQLVTIARAIAQKPAIILLDEPFSNLDTVLRLNIRRNVLSLLKSKGITVLLVTHDPEEALEVSDVIYVMRDGHVVQHGTPHEIYYNPKDHMLARFFGEVNHFVGIVRNSYITLPIGKIPAQSFNDGEEVVVCIRPEAIISDPNRGIKGIVEHIKFFNNMVSVCVEGHSYWMRFNNVMLPQIGDTIFILLDLNKILLFKI